MVIGERLWRRLLIVASAITLCTVSLFLASIAVPNHRGAFPFQTASAPGGIRITQFNPGYSDDPQGLQVGDVIELDRAEPTVIAAFAPHALYANSILDLPVRRGSERFVAHVRVRADVVPNFSSIAFVALGDLWMLAFAFAIGVRGTKEPHARILCLVLLAFALPNSIFNASSPWLWYEILGFLVGPPGMAISALLFTLYAMRAIPGAITRRAFLTLGVLAVVMVTIASVALTTSIIGRNYPMYAFLQQPLLSIFVFAGRFSPGRLVALTCAIIGIASSTGVVRGRLGWAAAAIGPWYASSIWISLAVLGAPLLLNQNVYNVNNFFVFLVPLGLTYAALSRRVFDLGFVLNRAVVFGLMSLVVVSCFVLLEWALAEWVKGANHLTSIYANVILALGLGISMRYIHLWVDRFVDQVFFRKRHEDERELRRFAHEAGFITDAVTLTERAIQVVERCADASFARIALADGSGALSGVDRNDRAIVALRAWSDRVDLKSVDTSIDGEFAFPMVVRGKLLGAFIIGPKRSGDSYAPDESDAIAHLAIGVGAALEALGSSGSDWRDALLAEVRALPEAIAKRLRLVE